MKTLENEVPSKDFEAGDFKFDAQVARDYDRGIRLSCPGYDSLHEMIAQMLGNGPSDMTFLSVGAGTGAEMLSLGKKFPHCRFIAVEPALAMMEVCRGRLVEAGLNNRVDYFNETLETYRPAQLADAASAIFVSHFIAEHEAKRAFFVRLANSIKEGGQLFTGDIVGNPQSPHFRLLFDSWIARLVASGFGEEDLAKARDREHKGPWIDESQYLDILEQAGFTRPVRFFQSLLWGGWVAKRVSE